MIDKAMKEKNRRLGRRLTYEEQNAAEAAFSCQPFNPDWSGDARMVYRGIVDAMWGHSLDCEFETCQILYSRSQ